MLSGFFLHGKMDLAGQGVLIFKGFTITLGRTLPDEWSARRRDRYLTKYNTHKRQTYITPEEFETRIPASVQPQINAIDSVKAVIGQLSQFLRLHSVNVW